MKLTEEQVRIIHRYRELISEASSDLGDSMKTSYMSESKSSVYALMQKENFAGLPDDVTRELARLAEVAWGTVICGDSAYRRAARTSFNVGELERYTDRVLNLSADSVTGGTTMKDGAEQILGKRINGVILKQGVKGRPDAQVILTFDDNTWYEFYVDDNEVFNTGGVNTGDFDSALEYMPTYLKVSYSVRAESEPGSSGQIAYPKPDRSDYTPGEAQEDGIYDIGWDEGVMSDGRPWRAEAWAQSGITMLTFFFSSSGLEYSSSDELLELLVKEGLLSLTGEEVSVRAEGHEDASGNFLWSMNVVIGLEDELPSVKDNIHLKPYDRE